jgi:lysozyme family protein
MPFIFKEEGGMSLIRSDRGNWTGGQVGKGVLKGTNMGIAASSHPNLDIPNLTKDQATIIYANEYWGPAGCDKLPAGVDLSVFDPAVNSGVSRGKAHAAATGNMMPEPRIKAIAARRTAFYKGLKDFSRFGKVWLGRTARCEAASLKMALAAAGATPVLIATKLQAEATASKKTVTKAQTGAAATGTAGATAATLPATEVAQTGTSWGLVIVAVVICGLLFWLAIHVIRAQQERAKAMTDEAGAVA